MKARWHRVKLVIQPGDRTVWVGYTQEHGYPTEVQELWRWYCATCSTQHNFVGGNGDDIGEGVDWFEDHLEREHPEIQERPKKRSGQRGYRA